MCVLEKSNDPRSHHYSPVMNFSLSLSLPLLFFSLRLLFFQSSSSLVLFSPRLHSHSFPLSLSGQDRGRYPIRAPAARLRGHAHPGGRRGAHVAAVRALLTRAAGSRILPRTGQGQRPPEHAASGAAAVDAARPGHVDQQVSGRMRQTERA